TNNLLKEPLPPIHQPLSSAPHGRNHSRATSVQPRAKSNAHRKARLALLSNFAAIPRNRELVCRLDLRSRPCLTAVQSQPGTLQALPSGPRRVAKLPVGSRHGLFRLAERLSP